MENSKETLENIKETIRNFLDFLDKYGYELNEEGDIVPKNINKQISLELKNEK